MARVMLTQKRIQIDKANVVIVASITVAVFVTIFALVASRALLSQRSYQSKVISQKQTAKKQLDQNLQAVETLETAYKAFVGEPTNIIGGLATGSGERDGDNARIILDALPSKYDYPALATSVEKLVTSKGATFESIDGTDDEVSQAAAANGTSTGSATAAVEMPFEMKVNAGYGNIKDVVRTFEISIRPFVIDQLTITAVKDGAIGMEMKAKTYYQPEKTMEVKSEVVR